MTPLDELKALRETMVESINQCCAEKAGQQFCETFGCGNILGYAAKLHCIIASLDRQLAAMQKICDAAEKYAAVRAAYLYQRYDAAEAALFAALDAAKPQVISKSVERRVDVMRRAAKREEK